MRDCIVSNKKNGLTKSGFSLSFSCCGRFSYCDLGRGDCFFKESDPSIQKSCRAWKRHHEGKEAVVTIIQSEGKDECFSKRNAKGEEEIIQLSLFD